MRIAKFIVPVIILAMGIGSFVYFKSTRVKPEPIQARRQAPMVSVEPVRKITASPMIRLFGTVETPSFGLLTAAVEADVLQVNVLEGDSVVQGQELIVLDDADIKLEVLQRGAELAEIEALIESDRIRLRTDRESLKAEKELLSLIRRSVERAKTLAKTRAASEATLDDALQNEQRQLLAIIQRQKSIDEFPARQLQLQARRQKVEATREKAERDLARTKIEAPFSGRIAQVMVSKGNRVRRGGQLVNLYDESRLELRIQVPLSFVPKLQTAIDSNQVITAETTINGDPVELTFHRLSSLIEKGHGGVDAFFRSGTRLPALGTTLGIWVNLPAMENVVQLSPDALYDRSRVYVVNNSVLESRGVNSVGEIVGANGRSLILLDGDAFEEGELVMTSRLPQAVSGLTVEFNR
jgi:multidrug efflux pump subunit AcrA (membrane-fusion protein)